MKIGFFADVHHATNRSEAEKTAFQTSVTYYFETIGVDILIFGGDNVAPIDTVNRDVPHVTQATIEEFWSIVDATGHGNSCYGIIGNHDCPASLWAKYSGIRGVCPREILYPASGADAGISLLLMNTAGQSVTGGKEGVGYRYGYVPYTDAIWMKTKLEEAVARNDVRIVFGHHHMYFTFEQSSANYIAQGITYWLCLNCYQLQTLFEANAPVIVMQGHTQPTSEGHRLLNDVYLTYQKHWYNPSGVEQTISYLDINQSTGNVKMITVDADLSTDHEIMNVTPTW